ncbi:MAG: ketopantoate reductase family protein [Spirochaetaceae bacterium]|jgi:2-dehydropantoate 2-reductase|nr:ketopantoate reductase family protein [Spirochaetaceae bacterium]
MEKIPSVLVAGAGAVGLTVAGQFFDYDRNSVAILASGGRLARYREKGLFVNGRRRDFILADGAFPGEKRFDMIVFAVKFHQLDEAICDAAPFVSEHTVVVSLLNGISSEEIIAARLGREKMRDRIPLAMILGVDAQCAEGRARYTVPGVIHFGDAEGRLLERDELIAGIFTRAHIPFMRHEKDMKRALWYKFMFNAGINQVSALLRLPYGALKKDAPGTAAEARDLMYDAMDEVIAAANAEGIDLNGADRDAAGTGFAHLDDAGYTSMCQDVLAKRKTEVEMFSRVIMDLGKKHGIPVPVNTTLYRAIRTVEQRY